MVRSRAMVMIAALQGSVTDENGHTTQFNRDSLLNITEIIDASGNKTNKQYDENSNLVSVTDALGRTSTISYDAANRPNLSTNFLGRTVENAFDANGNLISVEDEQEKVTAFAYDANNRPVSTIDPLGYQVTQNRDALGRTTLLSNARGGTVGYTYNADGLRTAKSHSGVTVATFAYDSASNMTSMTDSSGTTTFTYDGNRRVTAISYPDGLSVSLAYDPVGNLKSVNYPGGLVVSYTHDNRNRPASVSWGGNSISLTYDPVGNLTEETRSNGTKTTYSYDSNNRVIDIRHSRGTTPFAHIAYTRNALGNTIQETPVVPLTSDFATSSIAATYNDANQIVTRGSNTYAYDADGNIIDVSGSSFSLFNHTYDEENRLSSSLEGLVAITYTYNALGERTRVVTGGQTRNYRYGPTGRLLFETDGSGQVTVCYIYGGGRLLALGNPSGGYSFYHFDKTGNTVALTDSAGNVSAAYAYLPFGSVNRSGSVYNPFTFVGAYGVMEDGNGQYFMRNRYYGSGTRRFFQKDPIGFAGGQTNLYAYVGNNPVDGIDWSGLLNWAKLGYGFFNVLEESFKQHSGSGRATPS